MKSRILICGGRDFNNSTLFDRVMATTESYFNPSFCIIQGGARGADRLAALWAFRKGCAMLEMRANWNFYNLSAGRVRNSWMLEFGMPDLVIAFPGGAGTQNMVQQAQARGFDVYVVPAGL